MESTVSCTPTSTCPSWSDTRPWPRRRRCAPQATARHWSLRKRPTHHSRASRMNHLHQSSSGIKQSCHHRRGGCKSGHQEHAFAVVELVDLFPTLAELARVVVFPAPDTPGQPVTLNPVERPSRPRAEEARHLKQIDGVSLASLVLQRPVCCATAAFHFGFTPALFGSVLA